MYAIPNHVLLTETKTGAVLLHTRTNVIYALNPIGLEFLQLTRSNNWDHAIQLLCKKYHVPVSQIDLDMKRFVQKLVEKGLMTYAEGMVLNSKGD